MSKSTKGHINRDKLGALIDADKIRGFDLSIDPSVQKICEVYNSTSGSTRGVIYVLMIVTVVTMFAVLNTSDWNWTKKRIKGVDSEIINDAGRQIIHIKQFRWGQHKNTGKTIPPHKTPVITKSIPAIETNNDSIAEAKFQQERIADSAKLYLDIEKKKSLYDIKINADDRVTIPLFGNSFDINDLSLVGGITFMLTVQ